MREHLPKYPFEYTFDKKDIETEERLTDSRSQERVRGILNYDNRVQIQIQREVLILPYRASSWKNIEAVWRQECADKTRHIMRRQHWVDLAKCMMKVGYCLIM